MDHDDPPAGARPPESDAVSPPPARASRRQKDRTVHVALITGGFGLVPLLLGFLGLPAAVTPPTAHIPTVTFTATVTTTESVKVPASASAGPSTSKGAVRETQPSLTGWLKTWNGQVTLVSTFTDLDEIPPVHGLSDVKALGFVDGVYLRATRPGNLAKVAVDAPSPSPGVCLSLIEASGDEPNRLTVTKGDRVCLRTSIGRIVLLDITHVTVHGESNSSVAAYATVWTGPDSGS
jgi:hypothetical protein